MLKMKKILRSLACIICLITISTQVQAQKYGHVNLGNLLTQLPEVEAGSKQLESHQAQLVDELRIKVADWEKRYKALESMVKQLPPNEVREKEEKLVAEQRKLLQEEQMITAKVNEKRNQIMGPIIQRVQVAINAVGAENGYTMIFDTSIPNAILFVNESVDLANQVKVKLGIK